VDLLGVELTLSASLY
jgi:hypothetical protein